MRTSLRPADLLDLTAWPKGMRAIMRRELPHQGAQLRFEDVGGYRLTAFATNTKVGQLADLEVRHRLRARCEDRIRCAKDTGLDRFPLQGFAQNRIWCLIVALARRPAGLLPAARPGRRPRPRLGAPHDPPATDLTWLIVGWLGCWGLVVVGIVRVAWVGVHTNLSWLI